MRVFIAQASYTKEATRAIAEMGPFAAKFWLVGASPKTKTPPGGGAVSGLARESYAPPPAVADAEAETSTETLTFAWMFAAALTAAATWPLMHSA